jgi:hypothetical protein
MEEKEDVPAPVKKETPNKKMLSQTGLLELTPGFYQAAGGGGLQLYFRRVLWK